MTGDKQGLTSWGTGETPVVRKKQLVAGLPAKTPGGPPRLSCFLGGTQRHPTLKGLLISSGTRGPKQLESGPQFCAEWV